VKFRVSWNAATAANNRVWVWVDFCSVAGVTPGTFSPATISPVSVAGGSYDGQNGRGLYIYGNPSTVTAALSNATGQFNWCAYGSDYPPNAVTNAGGGYTLRGTRPFTINGSLSVDSETFSAGTCITSITDPTGHPGGFADNPTITGVTSPTTCYNQTATLSATASGAITNSMTYTWNIGGTQSTSTAASITSQNLAATTTYTVTARNANGCTSAVSNKGTITVRNNFNPGTIATTGQAICSGAAVNTIGNSIAASGGDNSISYQWYRNGSVITGATATTYAPTAYASTVGVQTFTRRAKDGTCNTTLTASTGQWMLTVNALPTITLTTANHDQTVETGSSITPIKYTTANANGASISGQPSGVSGAWASNTYTVSGTPTAAGTFTYTVTTTNSNGCTNVTATGKIVVNSSLPPSSGSWVCGAQTWSGMLRNPVAGCAATSILSTTNSPPAQYLDNGTTCGYYYNWTCVNTSAAALCPSPWRVPDQSDFNALISCSGGENGSDLATNWPLCGAWIAGTGLIGVGDRCLLWSSTPYNNSNAWRLFYNVGLQNTLSAPKTHGYVVRCVK
jgi:hypothetical protein